MGRWQEVEHTADLAVCVWGQDLPDLFRTAAQALFSLSVDSGPGIASETTVNLSAPDVASLLVEWLNELLYLSEELDSVFSLDLISRVGRDGSVPTADLMGQHGVPISPNGKVNVGLGRPLFQETAS